MRKTSLFALATLCAGMIPSLVQADPVVSRTETSYSKQNEIIMDGYTPLDPIDNSVKTETKTFKVPAPVAQPVAQPIAQPMVQPVPAQQVVVPQGAMQAGIPAQIAAAQPVPSEVCAAGTNCPGTVTNIQYTQSPVKVQYPVVRQYPVSVEYPVTVQRDVTVRQPVVVEQPVVVQKPVVVNQPVTVERAPAYVRQQPVKMQQPASYVQQQPVVVQAPAGQVLPPCTTGNCQ